MGDGPTVGSLATATAGFRSPVLRAARPRHRGRLGRAAGDGGPDRPRRTAPGASARPASGAGPGPGRRSIRDALEPGLGEWFAARLVPKLLVASQTKVVEVVVDEAGELLPSVPVVSVEAPVEHCGTCAALSSPPVTAWCVERSLGSGLSADAVRLSAELLLEVPLPTDRRRWTRAKTLRAVPGAADRREALLDYARLSCQAFRVPDGDVDALCWPGGPIASPRVLRHER